MHLPHFLIKGAYIKRNVKISSVSPPWIWESMETDTQFSLQSCFTGTWTIHTGLCKGLKIAPGCALESVMVPRHMESQSGNRMQETIVPWVHLRSPCKGDGRQCLGFCFLTRRISWWFPDAQFPSEAERVESRTNGKESSGERSGDSLPMPGDTAPPWAMAELQTWSYHYSLGET